ncbi:Hypothetical protein D9617_4g001950 [Elsinoe fawcettii]|nr:Hypothetical protein D9617_4g001950 [Elsinoe fawcettii]
MKISTPLSVLVLLGAAFAMPSRPPARPERPVSDPRYRIPSYNSDAASPGPQTGDRNAQGRLPANVQPPSGTPRGSGSAPSMTSGSSNTGSTGRTLSSAYSSASGSLAEIPQQPPRNPPPVQNPPRQGGQYNPNNLPSRFSSSSSSESFFVLILELRWFQSGKPAFAKSFLVIVVKLRWFYISESAFAESLVVVIERIKRVRRITVVRITVVETSSLDVYIVEA